MKKIKIIAISLYALWVGASAGLKITGIVDSWYITLSPIWLPLAVALVLSIALLVVPDALVRWVKAQEAKNPPSCANCLFGKTAKYAEEGKCLGEALDENIARGEVCKYYQKG